MKIDPDGFHIMKKSEYSGQFGDYSSYSEEYEELADASLETDEEESGMKNKLSRFAVPYEVWMAIFVVAPIVIMVVYAFSSADGGFTLDNFVQMGGYTEVFLRSFKLAIIATMICLLIGYPVSIS